MLGNHAGGAYLSEKHFYSAIDIGPLKSPGSSDKDFTWPEVERRVIAGFIYDLCLVNEVRVCKNCLKPLTNGSSVRTMAGPHRTEQEFRECLVLAKMKYQDIHDAFKDLADFKGNYEKSKVEP